MTRIETVDDLAEFMYAGETEIDVEAFWDAIGVSLEAIMACASGAAFAYGMDPNKILLFLTIGARFGLRFHEEDA